jgi:hypothetical protein
MVAAEESDLITSIVSDHEIDFVRPVYAMSLPAREKRDNSAFLSYSSTGE